MIDVLKTRTLVSTYQVCHQPLGKCTENKDETTLSSTPDGKWLLKDPWAHTDTRPMAPNGMISNRGNWKSRDLGEWVNTGEVKTTDSQLLIIVTQRARWTSAKNRSLFGGWDTRFVTSFELTSGGQCKLTMQYNSVDFPEGKVSQGRSENASCSLR